MKSLVIIGASGHGRVVADIAELVGYKNILFLDDDDSLQKCGDYPVAGPVSSFIRYDADFIVAIGRAQTRQRIQCQLAQAGRNLPVLVHPGAVTARSAQLGSGTVVMAGAVINPGAHIGTGCIINTCASVDHDCILGDYVHVSVGAHVAGTVTIGERTWIGAGAVVSNNLSICADCMVGAGAVVIRNIEEAGTYIGVPARKAAGRIR